MFAFLFAGEFLLPILILLVWFIVGLFCLVNDDDPRDGWMTVATIGAFAIAGALFQNQIVAAWSGGSLLSKLGTYALYFAGYLIVGLIYASVRIIRKAKKQAEAMHETWRKRSMAINRDNAKTKLEQFMYDHRNEYGKHTNTMVKLAWSDAQNSIEITPKKAKIVGWLSSYTAYWIVYMCVFFVHDIIEWLIDNLYGALIRRIMAQFDGFRKSLNESVNT